MNLVCNGDGEDDYNDNGSPGKPRAIVTYQNLEQQGAVEGPLHEYFQELGVGGQR